MEISVLDNLYNCNVTIASDCGSVKPNLFWILSLESALSFEARITSTTWSTIEIALIKPSTICKRVLYFSKSNFERRVITSSWCTMYASMYSTKENVFGLLSIIATIFAE